MARGRLEAPDLDDRTWEQIVAQARALILTYAPNWTDHNLSDPGITLIELFAWLVEGLIFRLNRVPDKNLIEFLNLIGVTRDPPTPASTYLTYRLATEADAPSCPRGIRYRPRRRRRTKPSCSRPTASCASCAPI